MMLPKSMTRNGWTMWHLVGAVVLVALGILVTHDAWADIFARAKRDEEASHIFLVPIIAAWLVWVRWERIRLCIPQASYLGPALVAIGWFLNSYGDRHAAESLWHSGAVLVVLGCLFSVVGREVLLQFLPAVVVLGFLVPVPGLVRQQIAIPLQSALARLTEVAFDFMGMQIERSGNLLSINGVDVTVVEACNGMRMVFALVLVSYAFAFSQPLRGYVRILILIATPLSALLANLVRMIPTIWIYGHFEKTLAEKFHDISGWVMLFVAFMAMLAIIRVMKWALIPITRYSLATA